MNVTPVGFASTVAAVAFGVGRDVAGGREGCGNEAIGTGDAAGIMGAAVSLDAAASEGEPGVVFDGIVLGPGIVLDWLDPAPAEQAANTRQAAIANVSRRVEIGTGRIRASSLSGRILVTRRRG